MNYSYLIVKKKVYLNKSVSYTGAPYLSPIAPIHGNELSDIFIRRPLWTKFKRSLHITGKNTTRRAPTLRTHSIKKEQRIVYYLKALLKSKNNI